MKRAVLICGMIALVAGIAIVTWWVNRDPVSRADRAALEVFNRMGETIRRATGGQQLALPPDLAWLAVDKNVKIVDQSGSRAALIYCSFGRGENFIGYLWDIDGTLQPTFATDPFTKSKFVVVDNRVAYIDITLQKGVFGVSRLED